MNEEWLVCYLFLALDCSLPILEALVHAPLLIQQQDPKNIDLVVDYFITKVKGKYGSLRTETRHILTNQFYQQTTFNIGDYFLKRFVTVAVLWKYGTREVCFYRHVKDGRFTNNQEIVLTFLLWKKQMDDQLAICPQVVNQAGTLTEII